MRLVRFQQKTGENRIGVMVGANYVTEITGTKVSFEPLLDFLNDPKAESKARLAADSAKKNLNGGKQSERGYWSLDSVTVLPPIAHPTKIICMGGNFSDHLVEGRKDALDYVAGFSVFNDISARDIQFAEMKRGFCNLGKNFDTFGPMGPCLVTPDQAGNPDNLGMELRVNGQIRQLSSTKKMVFKVRELVEFFSSMTLEPGDIITSGTPSGVAIYRKPDKEPYLLRPGDGIEAKVENLGRLQNTVVDAQRAHNTALSLRSGN